MLAKNLENLFRIANRIPQTTSNHPISYLILNWFLGFLFDVPLKSQRMARFFGVLKEHKYILGSLTSNSDLISLSPGRHDILLVHHLDVQLLFLCCVGRFLELQGSISLQLWATLTAVGNYSYLFNFFVVLHEVVSSYRCDLAILVIGVAHHFVQWSPASIKPVTTDTSTPSKTKRFQILKNLESITLIMISRPRLVWNIFVN